MVFGSRNDDIPHYQHKNNLYIIIIIIFIIIIIIIIIITQGPAARNQFSPNSIPHSKRARA